MEKLLLCGSSGEAFEVVGERATVGREKECDLFLDHKSISRLHARLEQRDDGWWVIDEGSTNGTFLQDRKVREANIHSGEKIQFGMLVFDVRIEVIRSERPTSRVRVQPARRSTRMKIVAPAPAPAPAEDPGRKARLAEAAARLGIDPSASKAALDEHFRKVWNDYQVRLTNAPTPTLRKLYQKNLAESKAAYDLLAARLES